MTYILSFVNNGTPLFVKVLMYTLTPLADMYPKCSNVIVVCRLLLIVQVQRSLGS